MPDSIAQYPAAVWDGLTPNTQRTSRNESQYPNAKDYAQTIAEIRAIQTTLNEGLIPSDLGVAEPDDNLEVIQMGSGIKRTTFTLENALLPTIDNGANNAHGALKLFTFPSAVFGKIYSRFQFGTGNIAAQTGGGTGLSDTATIELGLGTITEGDTGAELLNEEDRVLNGISVNLVGGTTAVDIDQVSTTWDHFPTTGAVLGAGPLMELWLNAAIADADHGATDDALILNGTIEIHWYRLDQNE